MSDVQIITILVFAWSHGIRFSGSLSFPPVLLFSVWLLLV